MTQSPAFQSFVTKGGLGIRRHEQPVQAAEATRAIAQALDQERGVLLSSNYDYPGRYTRWDMGFSSPLLEVVSQGRRVRVQALEPRGELIVEALAPGLLALSAVKSSKQERGRVELEIEAPGGRFEEEARSRQPSVFSVIRAICSFFQCEDEHHLGLYGAFGYDLAFQFEAVPLHHQRSADQRDLVLFLPENLVIVDHRYGQACRYHYEFEWQGRSTASPSSAVAPAKSPGLPHEQASPRGEATFERCDHQPGEYAANVEQARELFRRGDLFEVVLGQTFRERCERTPSEIFAWLRQHNPAPYGLLINLGQGEHLVGASPEMYVRVDGRRVETCPISGTIARGTDPMEDAERIRELLNSAKDESELSMCTDVDRNDKSRICEPGSVKVLGRRQIELYSRLIHTVDHVEGILRPEFDALDAFLSHAWAVTVTGAPKPAAIAAVERMEKSPRRWYGGAIGVVRFDGTLNTGLTLRTVRLTNGIAEVRAGATLLYDSDPALEERETRIKASAFLDAVRGGTKAPEARSTERRRAGKDTSVLLVDHEDSFVHTLGNYFRQTGARVVTLRRHLALEQLDALRPDLVVLSPGPGTPSSFDLNTTIAAALARKLPVFGVCLGLQGIAEYFGAELGVLDYPMHGKPSVVEVLGGWLFEGLPSSFVAGRYHSLYAKRQTLPKELRVTAVSQDGVVMALEHTSLPIAALQFHPESLLTLREGVGFRLVERAVQHLTEQGRLARRAAGDGVPTTP